jgi:uncharacterized membrane protein (UPF0127 family)
MMSASIPHRHPAIPGNPDTSRPNRAAQVRLVAARAAGYAVQMHIAFRGIFALGILFVFGAGLAADRQTVEIATRSGVHAFAVELATTEAERAKGLMYRKELPEGQGMLFDFGRDQEVSMWMKNTYVSLDMIFIRSDGRILRIAENTEPLSTRIVSSGGPVRAVLEVVAGTARRFGIAPGDRVAHRLFQAR